MKGVSEIVLIVLILLIGVSITALVYTWASDTVFSIYPEDTDERAHTQQRACLGIESMTNTKVVINNCGLVPLKNFKVFVNGNLQSVIIPPILDPGETYSFDVTVEETDKVQVTSDYAITPVVEFESKCVDAVECDDGNMCTEDVCYIGYCEHNPTNENVVCETESVFDSCSGSSACSGNALKKQNVRVTTFTCQTGVCKESSSVITPSNCPGGKGCYVGEIVGCRTCE